MAKYMMETGFKEVRMDTESGKESIMTSIRATGVIISARGMDFMNG